MDYRMPGSSILHYLLAFAQIHVHSVGDVIWPSHPLPPSSPFAFSVPRIRVFFQQLILCIRWPKYWGFSFSPSNEFSGLISFRIDWFDLLVVQRTLKEFSPASQFESINSSVLNLFYGPTLTSIHDHWEKTTALTIWTFVGKVVSLIFNMLSRFVITFLPRSKCLLISWRQPLQMLVHWIPIAFLVIYFLIQGNYNSLCSEGFPKESNHIRLDVICI